MRTYLNSNKRKICVSNHLKSFLQISHNEYTALQSLVWPRITDKCESYCQTSKKRGTFFTERNTVISLIELVTFVDTIFPENSIVLLKTLQSTISCIIQYTYVHTHINTVGMESYVCRNFSYAIMLFKDRINNNRINNNRTMFNV